MNLPQVALPDISKKHSSYSDFFEYYKITQVLERELELPILNALRIRQAIESVLNELYLIDKGKATRSMTIIYVFDKEFNVFCLRQDYDCGDLWAYGFATRDAPCKALNPAIIRHNGLPTDMQKIVREIQKEQLLYLIRNPRAFFREKIRLW